MEIISLIIELFFVNERAFCEILTDQATSASSRNACLLFLLFSLSQAQKPTSQKATHVSTDLVRNYSIRSV